MDRTKWPKMADYATLEEYSKVVKEYYGVTKLADTDTYYTWSNIIRRCYDPKHISYKYYGAKDVTVCDRWRVTKRGKHSGYLNFFNDVGPRPTDEKYPCGLSIWSIDRRDTGDGYELNNCRWATATEQAHNREKEIITLKYKGVIYSVKEVSEMVGLPEFNIYRKLNEGWSTKRIIETPLYRPTQYKYKDNTYGKCQLARKLGVSRSNLYYRLDILGMAPEEAINKPVQYQNNTPITFQDITMTASEWFRGTGNCSVSRETMSARNRQGFLSGDILRPLSCRHRVTKLYPTIIITIDSVSTEYRDIVDGAETTGILLLDIVAELNKEDGYVIYKELRPDVDDPRYDEYTVTYQGVTRTINEWCTILGKHSVTRYAMLERILEGLTGLQVLTPFIHGVVHPHPNYRLLDVTSVIDSKVVTYRNITECSHISNLPLDTIVAELEKEDGYITYNSDHDKYNRLVNGKLW